MSTDLPQWLSRVLGIAPTAAPGEVFALDGEELRYGSFHFGQQGGVFAAARQHPLPPGLFADGLLGAPLADPAAFASFVASFVSELPQPLGAATVILPDAWLRLAFIEVEDLPRRAREREEVLRWKLKRLVPFRVDDLRLAATSVPAAGADGRARLLVGFALEPLLGAIEDAFKAAGVAIGRFVNCSLALAAAVAERFSPDALGGLVAVFPEAYTLTVVTGGQPALYRYKATPGGSASELEQAVRRELRLTASYLAEHFPGRALERIFVASPVASERSWTAMLEEELGCEAIPIGFEHLGLARLQPALTASETAPLLGAVRLEVGLS